MMQILKTVVGFYLHKQVISLYKHSLNSLAGGIIFCESGRYLNIAGNRTPLVYPVAELRRSTADENYTAEKILCLR